ncbi:ATP-grasp domain-containing protein [Streptomyces sp. WI04-05B]|uniref:ATP-grasp domain-containing protein n=1 Tax=Streptomyces TaxID=1883 RepID=UPI0029BBC002|nr:MULTISPECIES: ATP-grasp domain-containing protein [unclassified Streptomyces]MDX2541818.1 ATP-grasp domain-containing protein [Streptomyces sp. WI04-05B]MDX2586900.1 ATP-grasp domain-containing protein [Streptomyces sp. WI04-05A]MDX3749868.1 ATP-grasp domain-containing protein [Streptomyces sp. AK08-02]
MAEASSPHLLFVGGAGDATLAVDVVETALRQARARGLNIHLTNQEATLAATPTVNALADTVSAVDFSVRGESAEWVRERTSSGERYDVVFGVREMAQEAVAEVADALGLPGNAPDAVHRVRTKDEARAHLTAAGFRQPRFRVCATEPEAREFLAGSTGPWVVKPRDAMGSEGVTRIDTAEELPAALDFLPRGHGGDGDPGEVSFIVEEFVEGPEYSAEGVFLGGAPHILALTSKELLPPPNFFEIEYVIPAILPDPTAAEIERQVVAALTALGLSFGQFHVELWWTEHGVVLGEVHVRNAGGWIHRMLPHVIPGLEWFGLVYDDVLGNPVDKAALKPVRGSAIRFLTPPPGRLLAIEGWDEVLAHPAVLHAELAIAPGTVVEAHRSVENRVGHIAVGADTPEEAQALARKLEQRVRFVTEPVE